MATIFKIKYFADNSEDQYSFFSQPQINQPIYYTNHFDEFAQPPIINDQAQGKQKKTQNATEKEKEEYSKLETTKTKAIKKQKKKHQPKRMKDVNHNIPMGRPDNNQKEKEHLIENRSFNDIVYHMSRMMIFLSIQKEKVPYTMHSLSLTEEQSFWMSSANEIMSIDNFPAFDDQKPIFILHPNTPHFIFSHQKKVNYSSEEVKCIMWTFLQRRSMLTTNAYEYLQKYWRDIIYLVNNPNSQEEVIGDQPKDQALDPVVNDMPSQQQGVNQPRQVKKQPVVSQLSIMKSQLQYDPTIIAYEIACYLHACCQKFELFIHA